MHPMTITESTTTLDVERIITAKKRAEVRTASEQINALVEQVRPTIAAAMHLVADLDGVERQVIADAEAAGGDSDAASSLAMSLTGSCALAGALAELSDLANIDDVLVGTRATGGVAGD